MKIHYTNILLFPLKLNILVNTHKKPHTTARHTQKIPTTRSLSECELYAPVNYYSDPQMKEVMDNFNKQTQQRFHEYDERMKTIRQKCKDTCDKEIQKIILKDKLEKQMAQQFSTLHTDIHSDAIPTCICEKSLADKVEKGCLRCGSVLGGGVMPGFGAIGGTALYALNQLKPTAIAAATKYALAEGAAKGAVAVTNLSSSILLKYNSTCMSLDTSITVPAACSKFQIKLGIHLSETNTYGTPAYTAIPNGLKGILGEATQGAEAKAAQVSSATSSKIITEQKGVINTIYMSNQTAVIASIIAIVVIVLIMVIIYLILRYRRKKKMKKKLQYIKLLEE
ncbi:hypothetical protein PFDG_00176 [Plasmodium falciparum Dd2]|uniref:Rifin n=1 Tax=Plasmodium falciparum (isolate Dd2) TaxID=57267 RepID=A0A0L7LX97_PLAF4|nr:hypothetical protein PFDG_00176 [Plasmodium falciparum Dd2]